MARGVEHLTVFRPGGSGSYSFWGCIGSIHILSRSINHHESRILQPKQSSLEFDPTRCDPVELAAPHPSSQTAKDSPRVAIRIRGWGLRAPSCGSPWESTPGLRVIPCLSKRRKAGHLKHESAWITSRLLRVWIIRFVGWLKVSPRLHACLRLVQVEKEPCLNVATT